MVLNVLGLINDYPLSKAAAVKLIFFAWVIYFRASVTAVFLMEDGATKRFTRTVQGSSSDYKIDREVLKSFVILLIYFIYIFFM